MAKDPAPLPDSFGSENTGGLLTGFLADEDAYDRRALWRLGSWAAASVAAVIVALLANQSSIGWRREQVATADLARQSQQIQALARESQNETRRLASAIDTLNADRDRLFSRITVLEQNLDTATSSILRPNSRPAVLPTPAPMASVAAQVQAASHNPEPPPVVAPVATTVAAIAEKPPAVAEAAPGPVASTAPASSAAPTTSAAPATSTAATASTAPAAPTAPVASVAPAPPAAPAASTASATPTAPAGAAAPANTAAASTSTPLMASKSLMAPPDPAAPKLIEPEKPASPASPASAGPANDEVASVPAAEQDPVEATQAIAPKIQRTEFAVDVGGANSVGGLRALWRGLLKSRSNAALTTLHPLIVVKESSTGLGMQLRLVAGPLDDAAAAAKICAALTERQQPCETTVFDGQRLAMTADEQAAADKPPAPVKPAAVKPAPHWRSSGKRSANDELPKKPETSTLSSISSSLFGAGKGSKTP